MLPFAFFQPFHSNRIESTRRLVVESVGPFRNRLIYSSLRPTSSLKPPHIKSDQLDRKGELKASKRAAAHNLPLLGVSKNKSNGIESLVGNISSNMQSIGNEWKSWIPKRTNIENRTFNPPKDAYVNNQSPLKRITQFAFNTDGKLTGVKGNQPANIPRSFGQLQFKAKSLESGFVKNAVVLGKSVNNMQILSPSLAFSGLTLLESQRISKSTQQKQIEIEDIEEIDSAADEVLRDTFHEDKFLNSHNNQNNYKKTHSEVFDSRDLRDDILENLSNLPRETHLNSSILKNVNKQSKSVFDSSFKPNYSLGAAVVMKTSANEEVEITSGELRYQRYQESLRIDKIKFQNKVPIDRKSDNYREFIQSTHSKELHQQQPLSLGNKHIASESTYCKTQIEQSYVDRKAIECISEMKGDEKPKIDGTNSNGARYLDIVQLKNETAARLRQQQERNSPPITERKSFTQKSDSRRAGKQMVDNRTVR